MFKLNDQVIKVVQPKLPQGSITGGYTKNMASYNFFTVPTKDVKSTTINFWRGTMTLKWLITSA